MKAPFTGQETLHSYQLNSAPTSSRKIKCIILYQVYVSSFEKKPQSSESQSIKPNEYSWILIETELFNIKIPMKKERDRREGDNKGNYGIVSVQTKHLPVN